MTHPGAESPGANEHVETAEHTILRIYLKMKHTSSPRGNTMKRQAGMSSEKLLQKMQKRPPGLFSALGWGRR